MNELDKLLTEGINLHREFLKLEERKREALIIDSITELDKVVELEQVLHLKMRVLESKRIKLAKQTGKTLREMIYELEDKELENKFEELNEILTELKKVTSLCKTLLEVRLHRLEVMSNKLGNLEKTYSNIDVNSEDYKEGNILNRNA